MVCASVREDNPRASPSGLSPVQMHEPYLTSLLHLYASAPCTLRAIWCCDSYSMVCASVREDNPRASPSGLSPVQMHEPYLTSLLHLYASAPCTLRAIWCCDSYSMVCASVREDNPRASPSGLSPVQMHEPYLTSLLHLYASAPCTLRAIWC